MKQFGTRKLCYAGILCAVAVVGSFFYIPVFGSKCVPVQHMVNILCAVLLGPFYGVGVAFCASLIRNLLGIGSLMVWGVALRACLLENKKYPSDLDCRGVWHSGFGRSVCISRCDSVYGNAGRADCVLCLCHSVSDFHGRRCDFVRYSAGGIAENRDSENGGSQIRR